MSVEPPCHEIVWKRVGSTRLRQQRFLSVDEAKFFYDQLIAKDDTFWAGWNEISVRRLYRRLPS